MLLGLFKVIETFEAKLGCVLHYMAMRWTRGTILSFQNDVVYQVAIAKGWIYED